MARELSEDPGDWGFTDASEGFVTSFGSAAKAQKYSGRGLRSRFFSGITKATCAAAALLILGVGARSAEAVTLSFNNGNESQGRPGDQVTIPLTVDNGTNISGFELDITFNSTVLANPVVTPGSLTGNFSVNSSTNTGFVRIVAYSNTTAGASAGSGSLANIRFDVLPNAPVGTTPLMMDDVKVFTDDSQLPVTVNNGTFRVLGDTNAPSVTVPGSQTVRAGETLNFNVTATDPDAADTVTLVAQNVPAGATFNATPGNPATGAFTFTPGMEQTGTFTVTFSASDDDGNTSAPRSVTITVTPANANNPPVLTVPESPRNVRVGQTEAFNVTGADPDGDTVTLSVPEGSLPDNATFNTTPGNPASGAFSFTPASGQTGNFTVTFIARDTQGNTDVETVTIVVSPPATNGAPTIQVPGPQTVNEGQSLSFTVSATDPENQTLTFTVAGEPANSGFDPATRTFTFNPAFNQQGVHVVTFFVEDPQGNQDTDQVPITVVNVNRPPVLTVPASPVNGAEGQLTTVTVSANDPDGDALTFTATNMPEGATFDAGTRTLSFTPTFTQAGTYTVTFTVTDGQGGTDSETVTIVIADSAAPNTPPVLAAIGAQNGAEGQAMSFTVSATDAEGGPVTFSATGLPDGATLNTTTGAFSFTPGFNQAGTYTVTFTATDPGGLTDSETVTITIAETNQNQNPTLTVPGPQTVTQGQSVNFTVTAADVDGGTPTLSAANLPNGATFNTATGAFSFTPATTGTFTVTFTATDAQGGTASQSVTITVNPTTTTPTNRPPALTVPDTQTVNEGEALTFVVTGSDPEGRPVTLYAFNLPAGANFNPVNGTFTFTPTSTQAGSYTVTFVADDNAGNTDSRTVTIVVTESNLVPILTVPATQNVNENQAVNFVVSATDSDGGTATLAASNLPTGATFDPATGVFSFTPTATQSGTFIVNFTATDNEGGTDTETVTITITNEIDPPVLTVPPAMPDAREGEPINFTISATDPDGGTLTYSASGLPTGATFDPNTGAFSFTPALGQTGEFTILFTVTDPEGNSTSQSVTITVGNLESRGSVDLGDAFGQPSDLVEVPLVVTSDLPLASGVRFTVDYRTITPATDRTVLVLADVVAGSGLTGGQVTSELSEGFATVSITGATPSTTGGPLAVLRFAVAPDAEINSVASINLSGVVVRLTDEQGNSQSFVPTVNGGSLKIILRGDVTGDGQLTIADATMALQIVVGSIAVTPELLARGDVAPLGPNGTFGDGQITTADVIRILRRIVGLVQGDFP